MKHTKTWEVIRIGGCALLLVAFCATGKAQVPAAGSAYRLRDDASAVKARDLDGTNATTPTGSRAADPVLGVNATTRAVLLANCPKGMSEADWLQLMANTVNAPLYPLRITQAMLDTLDAEKLDLRYQYVLVRELGHPSEIR